MMLGRVDFVAFFAVANFVAVTVLPSNNTKASRNKIAPATSSTAA